MKKNYVLLLLWLCCTITISAQITPSAEKILYVKQNVSGGTGDGSSWSNAIAELADALKWAREQYDADNNWLAGDSLRIFIAEGTYKPLYDADNSRYQNDGGRDNAFVPIDRVHLYGGFPATGNPGMNERNWRTYPTILSGDIGVPNDYGDNVYHVMITINLQNTIIDGLKITGGMANAATLQTVVNIKNTNLQAVRGSGAGMFCAFDNNSLKVSNVEITGNRADDAAGGDIRSSLSLSRIIVTNNIATNRGGGLYFASMGLNGRYVLTNALFTGNTATYGGAIYSQIDSLALVNTTIADNTATVAGNGIFHAAVFQESQVTLTNSVAWNSQPSSISMIDSSGGAPFAVNYSVVQSAAPLAGTGNFNTDPLFTNAANGDYTLLDASPGINAGSNQLWDAANSDEVFDLAGNTRVVGSAIEIGAYESQTALPVLFGRLSAVIKNGKLVFNWSTEAETNNDHFLVQLSQDGVNWTTVQKVQSLAASGNSDTILEYSSTIPLTTLSLGAGLFFLSIMAFKNHRRTSIVATAVLLCTLNFFCSKKEAFKGAENGELFARLVQIDKDGTEQTSKVIRIVQE